MTTVARPRTGPGPDGSVASRLRTLTHATGPTIVFRITRGVADSATNGGNGLTDAGELHRRDVGGAPRRAVAVRSAAPPTGPWSPRSTSPPGSTPRPPSQPRGQPSTTARGRAPAPASGATSCSGWPTCCSVTGRHRPDGVARHRQAARRERDRRRRRDQRLSPLRPRRRQRRRPGRRHRQPRRRQPRRARAGRRLRPDHSVELPAPPGLVEGRPCPGGRMHLRAQAERAVPAHRHPPDEAARRGRPARRGGQPGGRRRTERRGRAQRGRARRPGLVHRRARDRQADHGHGGRHGEEGRPRARWQEPQHRLRRRRPRGRTRQGDDRGVPALRPGLLGRRPPRSSRSRSPTEFVAELVERARDIRLGGPFDEKAETGALISQQHLDKVAAYVEAGVGGGRDGARGRSPRHRGLAGRRLLLRPHDPRRRRRPA